VIAILDGELSLHRNIAGLGFVLGGDTNSFQKNWRDALERLFLRLFVGKVSVDGWAICAEV